MPVWDALVLVADMLSWIGLGIGLPLLLLGLLFALVEGPWLRVEIVITERDSVSIAHWFAGGHARARPLRRGESGYVGVGSCMGVVSSHNPGRVRLGEPPQLRRVLLTLGTVFFSVGVLGFVGSLLPLFF